MVFIDNAELEVGLEFDGLRLTELLGAGGWGVVYRAYDSRFDRDVAVKVMRRDLAADPANRFRFSQECKLLARIEHPNVVTVYSSGEVEGLPYFVMRLVPGGTLRELLSGGRGLAPERAVRLVSQVADAVAALHSAGIVHRDIKPANVLLDGRPQHETPRLADFGLACRASEAENSGGERPGTFEYMAPEQRRGGPVGPAADVYALGVMLYEAVAGYRPDIAGRCPPPPLDLDDGALAERLRQVCARAMATNPQDRYLDARTMAVEARGALADARKAVPASIGAFDSLDLDPSSVRTSGSARSPLPPGVQVRSRRRGAVTAGIAAALALVIAAAWLVMRLSVQDDPSFALGTYEVCAETLQLRESPAAEKDTRILGTLVEGDAFAISIIQGTWAKGRSPRLGKEGWAIFKNGAHTYLKTSC